MTFKIELVPGFLDVLVEAFLREADARVGPVAEKATRFFFRPFSPTLVAGIEGSIM